jgi:hypothetical protein
MANHWTDEDMVEARRLYDALQSYKAVARIMGRSATTINEQLNGLRGLRINRKVKVENIPQEVLADRDYRADLPPRSLSAAFFGDPLPGYSALERR